MSENRYSLASLTPTVRFSNAAGHYARHRPSYPSDVFNLLEQACGLKSGATVADIGAGTGLFSQLHLAHQYRVFCIEPNSAMRRKFEAHLPNEPVFMSRDAAAEATGLDDHSVDCITAATAFHWFDKEKA